MRPSQKKIIRTYDRQAGELARIYNNLSSSEILPGFESRLPAVSGQEKHALDVACGSGRDALFLARKGFKVTAFDGSENMIKAAKEQCSHPGITYLQDVMPEIEKVKARGLFYDVILLSAAIMHLKEKEQKTLIDNLAGLCKAGGLIYMSVRQGPSPEGRDMYDVDIPKIKKMACDKGLGFEYIGDLSDKQGRAPVTWKYIALRN
jgi:2-polyprenyl-3-methyl-5-hydroxy-6-metoxy-1,4-benzoquinol methylase